MFPSGFLSEVSAARSATEWSGDARTAVGPTNRSPASPGQSGVPSVLLKRVFLSVSSLSGLVSLADRVSPRDVCRTDVVPHQLLSGQGNRGSPPMVSCLWDCGDRGLRPF